MEVQISEISEHFEFLEFIISATQNFLPNLWILSKVWFSKGCSSSVHCNLFCSIISTKVFAAEYSIRLNQTDPYPAPVPGIYPKAPQEPSSENLCRTPLKVHLVFDNPVCSFF